jgi:hypothetical protein
MFGEELSLERKRGISIDDERYLSQAQGKKWSSHDGVSDTKSTRYATGKE